jgi:hypothetical protein
MKIKVLLIVLLASFLACPAAWADTFMGSTGGSWQPVPVLTESPPPFWDNGSWDGNPPGNVGFLLTSTDGSLGLPVPNLQYWALDPGRAVDTQVVFNGVASGQAETLIFTFAANAPSNSLYAYNTADLAQTTLLLSGVTSTPQTVTVDIPYAQYGFMLVGPGGTFYSGDSGNFAFFRDANLPGTWWIGVEDLALDSSDGDYNDMIIKFSTVPLPPAVLPLGSGLLGLLGLGWRRKTG